MAERQTVERRGRDRRKDSEAARKHMGIEKRQDERRTGKPRPKKKPGLPKNLP